MIAWKPTALTLLLVGWASYAAEEPILYRVEGDQLIFTNVPAADARPVPGRTNPRQTPARAPRLPTTIYDGFIDQVAAENGISPELIKAVALVESSLDPHAVSPAGAKGLMQLMPTTAAQYGVADAFDPMANLRAGTQHLRSLLDEFDGNLDLALAAYNAGSGAVRRHNGIPAYAETVEYVRKVHEKLGRTLSAMPAGGARPPVNSRPVTARRLRDGSLLLTN